MPKRCAMRRTCHTVMLACIRNTITRVAEKNKCMVKEFNGETDHVHILLDFHPDNNLSAFIGSMKTASSRIVRSEFKQVIEQYY